MKETNMNRGFAPVAIAVIVLVALALGGGVYYSVKNSGNIAPDDTTVGNGTSTVANLQTGGTESQTGTLRGLLTKGNDLACVFNSGATSTAASGTMYVSGTMMRGDFAFKGAGGSSVDSHMIRQGNVVYVWSGNQGTKMEMSQMNADTSAQSNGLVNLDQNVNYTCSNWKKDDAKFTAPTTVTFTDMSALLKQQFKADIPVTY